MFTWLAGESALMLATEAHSLGSCLPPDPVVSRPPARENPQPVPAPALSSVRWRVVGPRSQPRTLARDLARLTCTDKQDMIGCRN